MQTFSTVIFWFEVLEVIALALTYKRWLPILRIAREHEYYVSRDEQASKLLKENIELYEQLDASLSERIRLVTVCAEQQEKLEQLGVNPA
jgi:hypothetical protein